MAQQRTIRLAIASAAMALTLLAPTTEAARPAPIDMVFAQDANTYATLGWVATGAVDDTGDWVTTRFVLGSPRTLLFGDVDTIQTSTAGTFRLQWHGGTTPEGGVAATWRITDGTGIYAGMRGEGRWTQTWSGDLLTFHVWGSVHSEPSS